MNQAVKLLAAGAVMLVGISVAMLFRHKPEPTMPTGTAPGDHLVLRRHINAPRAGVVAATRPAESAHRTVPVAIGPEQPSRVTYLMPIDHGQPPPAMAKECPVFDLGNHAVAGGGIGTGASTPSRPSEPTQPTAHRIADGDSLESLAERYLGAAGRAEELLEANRELLPNPTVLPIGLELRIPPRRPADSLPGNLMPKRALSPLPAPESEH